MIVANLRSATLILTQFVFIGLSFAAAPTPDFSKFDKLNKAEFFKNPSEKKGSVLIFMSASCPCSNSHVDTIKTIANDFKEFEFIGIHSNADEPVEFARQYFIEKQILFPIISDPDQALADQFEAQKTPHAVIIGLNGKVHYQGGITSSASCKPDAEPFLKKALSAYRDSKYSSIPEKMAETRVLGCLIKRRKN